MKEHNIDYLLVDGSGAGVSINPIAFLIVENDKVRLLPVNHSSCIDKLLDYVPDLFEKISKTKNKLNCSENCTNQENEIKEEKKPKKDETNEQANLKNNKAHINKVPRTTEEKFEYNPKRKRMQENKEMAEELEELFEEEFEYDDD